MPRFKKRYNEIVRPELMKKFGYTNQMQVPKINKVVLNIGAGEAASDSKKIQQALNDLTAIAGQKAVVTRAKKAIATFKIREGLAIGAKVTLRGDLMYEFLDRLITMALPRVRDFRGVNPKSFDGRGNYAMGLKEHIVFLEIDYDKTETVWGMDIVFNTSAKTDEEAKALLEGFQFPFTRIEAAMAKTSQINRNKKREKLVAQYAAKRAELKKMAEDMKVPAEERFAARLKLAKLPRNSSKVRIHHRCELTGRSKGYYRKVKMSRIALRSLSNFGQIPGMTKASW